eukprot:57686_1
MFIYHKNAILKLIPQLKFNKVTMAMRQVETPGGVESIHYNAEGYTSDRFVTWLRKYDLSSDGIAKIIDNLSFKKIQTLSKHDRSLAKESADSLDLSVMDKVAFLDCIEDLRNHNSTHVQPYRDVNEEILQKTQMIQNMMTNLDANYKTQQQNIDRAFIQMIEVINQRKSNVHTMLNKMYSHHKEKLNTELSHVCDIDLNSTHALNQYCQLIFNDNHKADIIQLFKSFGTITTQSVVSKNADDDDNKQQNEMNEHHVESDILRWDKIRHGVNAFFLNDHCVRTGELVLVLCDSGINDKMGKHFIWEITVDRISMDASFIGYVNGELSNIDWNSCLTKGNVNNKHQFAVAFRTNSSCASLYGQHATKRKLKLASTTKKGDRFMFDVDFERKCVVLYQNNIKIDTIFTKISNHIIPAVSGRGGQYTIKRILDLSILEQKQNTKVKWSLW